MSLMAGLVFGGLSAYGAYNTSSDRKDIKVLMREYELGLKCGFFLFYFFKLVITFN